MQTKNIKQFLYFSAAVIIMMSLQSCTRDEIAVTPSPVDTRFGVYILSEGTFTPGSARLSFYNFDNDRFTASIFNPGALGLFPDGICVDRGSLFITEQGNFGSPGKIYKTDTNATVLRSAEAGINPYSVSITNGRIYVTNGPSNTVSVFIPDNLQLAATINVRNYPQELTGIGNRVFVCNFGSFSTGDDSVITVIDAGNNQVVNNIVVGKNPSSVIPSSDGKLLVGIPGDSSRGAIYKIDPINLARLDTFASLRYGFSKDLNRFGSDLLYFIAGQAYSERQVVSYRISTGEQRVILEQPPGFINYGLAIDQTDGNLYVAQAAADFVSEGRFRVYDPEGTLLRDFQISGGVTPRRIVVRR